ncbi:mitochondrial CIV assembly protein Cmc1 [Andalucia godoyi]|uniref:COX assembly mitochondrial protein n=1 Tax=Andalucia godoyi TaxID=505711 RepID=A0A8K0AJ45_ANDGO|nr:mitochondrial CIV assembly protein Cmc1 [Andalucia godoyi]|eukprot:ANDGO_08768.mRNA.1 mitochondrial CIV assembly protein Cmc1
MNSDEDIQMPVRTLEMLREKMKKAALKQCQHRTVDFGECSKEQGFLTPFKCREEMKRLNRCLAKYTHDEILEKYKTEWYAEQRAKQNVSQASSS